MKELEKYYEPDRPIQKEVDALTDPKLEHESHRGQVNELIMNMVIKYLAVYLEVDPRDVESLKRLAVEKSKMGGIDDLMGGLSAALGALNGERSTHTSESFALNCLSDVRVTAAIVKEIIFNQRCRVVGGEHVSFDFGSGSGILTLASMISGARKEANMIAGLGFEVNDQAVANSVRTLGSVLGESSFRIINADVTDPRFWKDCVRPGASITNWVSETISRTTLGFNVDDNDFVLNRDDKTDFLLSLNATKDPFPEIVQRTVGFRPGFFDQVRNGEVSMFPDIVNGHFTSDGENAQIRFTTGLSQELAPLHCAGAEFLGYEDLGADKRWEESTPEKEAGIHRDLDTIFGINRGGPGGGGVGGLSDVLDLDSLRDGNVDRAVGPVVHSEGSLEAIKPDYDGPTRSPREFYHPESSIDTDVAFLTDPHLDLDLDRVKINDRLVNLVIKYIALYFDVDPGDLGAMAKAVEKECYLDEAGMMDLYLSQQSAALSGVYVPEKLGALHSLIDVRATAALMKEIIFKEIDGVNGKFVYADFGSGTGVLSLAAHICAVRHGASDIKGFSFEIHKDHVAQSRKVLDALLGEDAPTVVEGDLSDRELYKPFANGVPLNLAVSETVSFNNPAMVVKGSQFEVVNARNDMVESALASDRFFDPYPLVMMNLARVVPGFISDVRKNLIGLFPDIVNGDFKPAFLKTALRLQTSRRSERVRLEDLGREFYEYEDFMGTHNARWQYGEGFDGIADQVERGLVAPGMDGFAGLSLGQLFGEEGGSMLPEGVRLGQDRSVLDGLFADLDRAMGEGGDGSRVSSLKRMFGTEDLGGIDSGTTPYEARLLCDMALSKKKGGGVNPKDKVKARNKDKAAKKARKKGRKRK